MTGKSLKDRVPGVVNLVLGLIVIGFLVRALVPSSTETTARPEPVDVPEQLAAEKAERAAPVTAQAPLRLPPPPARPALSQPVAEVAAVEPPKPVDVVPVQDPVEAPAEPPVEPVEVARLPEGFKPLTPAPAEPKAEQPKIKPLVVQPEAEPEPIPVIVETRLKPQPPAPKKAEPKPEPKALLVEQKPAPKPMTPAPTPEPSVSALAKDVQAEGRVLLRVLEHGAGPGIELAWPDSPYAQAKLFSRMVQCLGMQVAVLKGDAIFVAKGARGEPWDVNLDRFSGFLRQPAGRLAREERRQAESIRAFHGLGNQGRTVRLFPRQVDARLLGGLSQMIGADYRSAGRIEARYVLTGSDIAVRDVRVDGRELAGSIGLSKGRKGCLSARSGRAL